MRTSYGVLATLALTALLVAPQVFAENPKHQGPACSVDKLAGDWGFTASGKNAGGDFNSAGTFHLDRDGTSSAHLFANVGGSFVDFERFGITTVNDDCTLLQTWNDGGPAAHCVVVDDGNEMLCMYEPPTFSLVTLKRIHTRH